MNENENAIDTLRNAAVNIQTNQQQININDIGEEDLLNFLKEGFERVDEATQEFITSGPYDDAIQSIVKKYNLNDEETEVVQIAILLVLLKLYPQEKAEQDIILALRERSDAEIERIIHEIRKIFFEERENGE